MWRGKTERGRGVQNMAICSSLWNFLDWLTGCIYRTIEQLGPLAQVVDADQDLFLLSLGKIITIKI